MYVMREAIIVKIISPQKNDFEEIASFLSKKYGVAKTSSPIYDENKQKWHIFLSLVETYNDEQ